MHSKTSLDRQIMGPTLYGPFTKVVGLGKLYMLARQTWVICSRGNRMVAFPVTLGHVVLISLLCAAVWFSSVFIQLPVMHNATKKT